MIPTETKTKVSISTKEGQMTPPCIEDGLSASPNSGTFVGSVLRTYRSSLAAFSMFALVVGGCGDVEGDRLILQREWIANAEFAGDLLAREVASERGWRLDVLEGSEVQDPVQEVQGGRAHFGVASADRVLKENELGADLVVVAAATPRSPVVFVAKSPLKLDSPADFAGRSVGIQSGTNTELIFSALVESSGTAAESIDVVESGWGVGEFVADQVEILAVFAYDEPVELERRGIALSTLHPADHGVDFIGTVYFANASWLRDNQQRAKDFVDALLEGWRRTSGDPESALKILFAAYPRLDQQKERQSLRLGMNYFRGDEGRLLYASPERWQRMADVLEVSGFLAKAPVESTVNYELLTRAEQAARNADGV